jgi:hypothetical protein
MPGYAVVVLAVGAVAGAVAASRVLRAEPLSDRAGWLAAPIDVVVLAAGSGAGLAALSLLTSGPAGPGRLAEVGPVASLVGAAFAAEVAIGATLLFLVRRAAPALADAIQARRDRYRRGL